MTSAVTRILLRYLSAFLMAKGVITPEMHELLSTDPDFLAGIELVIGATVGAAVEAWFWASQKFEWLA